VALLKMAELRRLASFEDLLARFEALEADGRRPAGGSGGSGQTGGRPGTTTARRPAGTKSKPAQRATVTDIASTEASKPVVPPSPVAHGEFMEGMLERLRSAKPKLAALLSHHNGVTLEGDCLRLGFEVEQQFVREQIEQEDVRRLLEKEASEVAGRSIRVEMRVSSPDQPEETTSSEGEKKAKDELFERAMEDPMVRGFVETFQGEVEDVRPISAPSETKPGNAKR
jgi:hypothetical protein